MNLPRVSVFGLGYVGSVTAAVLAERGCSVIGCDVSAGKIELINAGKAPIGEPGLDELLQAQSEAGRVRATADVEEAVNGSEISIVCVGTPSAPSGALDLQYVETVSEQLAGAIRKKGTPHAVVYRSTMLPGSTRRLAETYFGEMTNPPAVFFFPEFLRQGSALADFRNPSLSVIGVLEPGQPVDAVSAIIEGATETVAVESAELLKYSCNAFHAVKVAFANEIGRIGKQLGIDSSEVMGALCRDTRLNISTYYLKPGTPFGGSCLPKDVNALVHHSRRLGVTVPLLASLMESNRGHLDSIMERVEAAGKKRVLLLGLAFKAGTDDLRGSAMLDLAANLLLRGYEVRIHDPEVASKNLVGANLTFANMKLPQFETLMIEDLRTVFADGEARTIVASKACASEETLSGFFRDGVAHHVIDVNGWKALAAIAPSYEGVCW